MFKVFSFYKFKRLKFLKKNKSKLTSILLKKNIKGTIIVSKEGINGTISSKPNNVNFLSEKLKKLFCFDKFDSFNLSKSSFQPFNKVKVKIKNEVVPMNFLLSRKINKANSHLNPYKWNEIIKDKKTLIIDSRKPFEFEVGTFKRSINPNIEKFRDFPKYLKRLKKDQTIAMFCTGGVRCEKASVYLERNGFKNVYQLKGGILNYLKKIPKKKSLWKGECFVFDNRVSVKHGLQVGSYSICSGCRNPISKRDVKSKKYEEGVSCPKCYNILSNSQKKRFRMRQNQINLAKSTGKRHIFQKEY